MFTITKEFAFEASHSLPHLPEGHKCRRPHGHSYRVRITVEADELDNRGFVVDYADLDIVKRILDGTRWGDDPAIRALDHNDLNQIMPLLPRWNLDWPTSAERLAQWFFTIVDEDLAIRGHKGISVKAAVSETAKTWAEYSE